MLTVAVPALLADQIDTGWLCWWSGSVCRAAWDFPFTTDLPTTQANFAAAFLGVCTSGKAAGVGTSVTVAIDATTAWLRPTVIGLSDFGLPLTPAGDFGTLDNTVLEQTSEALAIARVTDPLIGSPNPEVMATFASAYHTGSSNINAQVG